MKPPAKRPSLRITGEVDVHGKFKADDPGLWKLAFLHYAGKRIEFEPVPEGERRTPAQNRRWFGAIVPVWRAYFMAQGDCTGEESSAYIHHRAVAFMTGRHTSKGMTRQEFGYLMNQSELYLGERGFALPPYGNEPDHHDDEMPEGLQ